MSIGGDMDNRKRQGNRTGGESAAAGAGSRSLVSNIDGETMRAMFVASSPLAARLQAEYEQQNWFFGFNSGAFRSASSVVMNSTGRPVMSDGPPGFPVRPSHFPRPVAVPLAANNPPPPPRVVIPPPPAPANSSAATQSGQKRAAPETTTQETQTGSEGADFTFLEANVVYVEPGEDLSAKIIDFCLTKLHSTSSSVCVILSAVGAVSRATVQRNPTSHPNGFETFEGWHEIMSLGGSYNKWSSQVGGQRSIAGGLNITLAKGDGGVIAGPVGGPLIAASNIQVVLGSSGGDYDVKNACRRK